MKGFWQETGGHSSCRARATGSISWVLLAFMLLLPPDSTTAGGGPETTLVVVNAQSPLSLRIANEYIHLRDIPQSHILWLNDVPSTRSIPISMFRERIWRPINDFIGSNKLEREIDTIAYSADFPYGVDFTADLKSFKQTQRKHIGRRASLTALTYFAERVNLKDLGYLGKNHYFRDFVKPRKKPIEAPGSQLKLDAKQVKQLRREANTALRKKDYRMALENFQKLKGNHPQAGRGWHDLARGLAAAGRKIDAMAALANAVDSGWTNSFETRDDRYLRALEAEPNFTELIRRMETAFQPILLPHGFRHHYVWSNSDLTYWEKDDFKDQYYLSTLLAYTGIKGNSFPEVVNYLRAAASSDGTQPDGKVYLMANSNIRSKTRQHLFPTTLDELTNRGRDGEVLSKRTPGQNGIIPVGKTDIIGLVVGSPTFKWERSQSRLLPGAIAESLTSYGGDFNRNKQTKLSEFLRRGAAGSSGAVAEPYAFQEKFPVPMIHSFYAEGCSLAEAFYQSIEYPYQLIIVGDPLARPFARFADVEMNAPDPNRIWSGVESIEPLVRVPDRKEIDTVELWLDGRHLTSTDIGNPISLDTRNLANGVHRLRLIAVEKGRIETRSYAGFNIRVMNGEEQTRVDPVDPEITYGSNFEITGQAAAGSIIKLNQGHRTLGSTKPDHGEWKITIPSTTLGLGPVNLWIETNHSGGSFSHSAPIALKIVESERQPAYTRIKPLERGLSAVVYDQQGAVHNTTIGQLKGPLRFTDKKKISIDRLVLGGFFEVPKAGFYQLVIAAEGDYRLSINDRLQLDVQTTKKSPEHFLPLSLAAGWHKLHIELDTARQKYLKIHLAGDQIPELLGGDALAH